MGLFRKKKKPQYVEEILEFGEEIDLRSQKRAEKAKKAQKARQNAAAEQKKDSPQGQSQDVFFHRFILPLDFSRKSHPRSSMCPMCPAQ